MTADAAAARHAAPRGRRRSALLLLSLAILAGCHEPKIAVRQYPPTALRVRYVAATDYTDCLLASVVMVANYVSGHDRLEAGRLRREMRAEGLDPTVIGDFQTWAARYGLKLIALRGALDAEPPRDLAWWVVERGYPVICVINRHEGNPDYNHAVVVIGVDFDDSTQQVAGLDVLDPAAPRRLVHLPRADFERDWSATNRVMMLVFDAPRDENPAAARGVEP